MTRLLGLALYGHLAASTRYRLEQYIPGLAGQGIELQIHHLLDDTYLRCRFAGRRLPVAALLRAGGQRLAMLLRQHQFDAVILYAELFPFLPSCFEYWLLAAPYIYDFDDAFYLKYRSGKPALTQLLLGSKFDAVMAGAAAVTAGSGQLADYSRTRNSNTFLLPTVVDTSHHKSLPRPSSTIFTVGWLGSPTTAPYLAQLTAPLACLGREAPLRLRVVGGAAPAISNVEVEEVPWQEDREVELINSFDVGLMPLPDTEWARGKCAFKLIQYMACGLPVVASRVGANLDVVSPDCGFLAGNDQEWLDALRFLRDHPEVRVQMGQAGRTRVEEQYSLCRNLPLLTDIIRRTVASA